MDKIPNETKEVLEANNICDVCDQEFSLKGVGVREEKIEIDGTKFVLVYFACPHCNTIYKISLQDRKYYELVEQLNKIKKQIRNNFGTYNVIKAERLNKKLKKKQKELENHFMMIDSKYQGTFIFNKEKKVEYVPNE